MKKRKVRTLANRFLLKGIVFPSFILHGEHYLFLVACDSFFDQNLNNKEKNTLTEDNAQQGDCFPYTNITTIPE